MDGYCADTRTIYELLGCYYHGCKCQPFRDVKTLANGETLAERHEQTLARIEQLKSVGYTVKVQWECEFEGAEDLQRHPIVRHAPLNTRDALYGGRTEAIRLHYKIKEGEETSVLRYIESLPVHLQIFQVPHRSHDHSRRGHMCRHRSLSKDGRSDEMQDRANQGPLPPSYRTDMTRNCYSALPHVS